MLRLVSADKSTPICANAAAQFRDTSIPNEPLTLN